MITDFASEIKETNNRPKILIVVPTKHIVGDINGRLYDFLKSARDSLMFDVDVLRIEQSPVDVARNFAVDSFLKNTDREYLLFVDDDTIPPVNILSMVKHNKLICGAPVYIYQGGMLVPNLFRKNYVNQLGYVPWQGCEYQGLQKIDAIGTGCVLIHRKVFDYLEKPYFKTEIDANGMKVIGEDLYFCKKATDAGLEIWADTDKICGHIKTVDLASIALQYRKLINQIELNYKARG